MLRADANAETRLGDERMALQGAYAAIAERESLVQMQVQAAFEEQSQAREALKASEMRLADLQRLLEQQAAQIRDLQHERSEAQVREADVIAELSRVRAHSDAAATAFAIERDTLLQQLRGNEERAAAEIDRARQQVQRLQSESAARERRQHDELAAERKRGENLARDIQIAVREGDVQRARADVLEQQLSRLADLPAHVEAALRHARTQGRLAGSAAAKRPKRKSTS